MIFPTAKHPPLRCPRGRRGKEAIQLPPLLRPTRPGVAISISPCLIYTPHDRLPVYPRPPRPAPPSSPPAKIIIYKKMHTTTYPPASQPLPIARASAHDLDLNLDDLFSGSPRVPFGSSSWGTESSTDSGADSDPFCFDDETSQAIIHAPAKERVVEVVEVVVVGEVLVVQVQRRSLLKRWANAVWGVVAKMFRRGGRAEERGGTGAVEEEGKS